MEEVTLRIPQVDCEGCAYPIRMALRLVRGVYDAEVNARERTVTVRFDPGVATTEDIKGALASTGFKVQGD